MRTLFLLIGFLVGGLIAVAAENAEKVYTAAEAAKHVGETAVVTGHVDAIRRMESGMVLINIDGRYPNQAFTAVVRASHIEVVGDVSALEGKNVRIRGKITEYRGKPQIEIRSRTEIELAK